MSLPPSSLPPSTVSSTGCHPLFPLSVKLDVCQLSALLKRGHHCQPCPVDVLKMPTGQILLSKRKTLRMTRWRMRQEVILIPRIWMTRTTKRRKLMDLRVARLRRSVGKSSKGRHQLCCRRRPSLQKAAVLQKRSNGLRRRCSRTNQRVAASAATARMVAVDAVAADFQ